LWRTIDSEGGQIIKESDRPKFTVMASELFESPKEILQDYLDHLHAQSVIEKTSADDWLDSETVKKAFEISK